MKWITYDEVKHDRYHGGEEYRIDFDNGERKYKTLMHGVRVYEHGSVEVYNCGKNNPSWRAEIFGKLGLDFTYPKTMTGCTFENPDTGRKVPKSALPLWLVYYDTERERIYHVRSGPISFSSEHAQPFCSRFKYTFDNKESFTARMEQLRPYIEFGKALNMLDDNNATSRHWLDYNTRVMLMDGKLPEGELQGAESAKVCRKLAFAGKAVGKLVQVATKDLFTPQYLNVKRR